MSYRVLPLINFVYSTYVIFYYLREMVMQRKPCRQRGAILVMTVLFLVVLLGFSALALDLGRLYVLRTEMQNAADAAAMAAAAELDGNDNAISDAVLAAKNLLAHTGRFSTNQELISILKYDIDPSNSSALRDPDINKDNAFEFYSFISEELYPDMPNNCSHPLVLEDGTGSWVADEKKCLSSGNEDAHYVKVKLDPNLYVDTDNYYQISLYLAPVLGIFTGDPLFTASTKVSAVAGAGGPVFCEYPPLFMCAYDDPNTSEIEYPGINPGEEVILRPQAANTAWGPGNVGFLDVEEDIEIELDDGSKTRIEQNKDAMAAALGNEFLRRQCDPAIVSTLTGIDQQKTRKAFNTRFGLYDGKDGFDNAKKAFPPAPNTVDYPLDDLFTPASSSPPYDSTARKGTGWNNTECLMPSGCNDKMEVDANASKNIYTWPETFNRTDYILYNHQAGNPANADPTPTIDPNGEDMPNASRYSLYRWEVNSGTTPNLAGIPPAELPLDQENCTPEDAGKKYCWLHSGNPIDGPVVGGSIETGDYKRRILRVAVIKCSDPELNINGNTPDINLNYNGEFPFHEFFLTKHAQDPSEARFHAEYVGPVSEQQEIQKIRHTIIQLYE